ncbi:hypothetical protein A0H81_08304 [Grifola frondosa]|uniref:Uncharacterized protein n=1 Tax=Grifola frondosa TaxID=5627 RepID=A0A1C7M4T4_GRIFR|nr:hypothetical protein A0H81_08304 [Grifola frondosa]
MAAGVDKDQEVAAGIDVKEAAAAAEEGEAAGMTNSILDVDAQQDSPHMYNLAAPTPSPRSHAWLPNTARYRDQHTLVLSTRMLAAPVPEPLPR